MQVMVKIVGVVKQFEIEVDKFFGFVFGQNFGGWVVIMVWGYILFLKF